MMKAEGAEMIVFKRADVLVLLGSTGVLERRSAT